jgi:flagellar motor switch protein FliM
MVNLCIPYNAIERISGKLSANSWVAYGRRSATPESIEQIGRSLRNSLVELRVRLASTRITTGELLGLRVGDIVTTEKDVHSPLLVSLEGMPRFRARPGSIKGHKAICIVEVIPNPADTMGD